MLTPTLDSDDESSHVQENSGKDQEKWDEAEEDGREEEIRTPIENRG